MVELQQTLSPQDELTIIVNRRRPRSSIEPAPDPSGRPHVERRRHQHVDVVLGMTGFAIVPDAARGRPLAEGPMSADPIEPSSVEEADVEDAERNVSPPRAPRWSGDTGAPRRSVRGLRSSRSRIAHPRGTGPRTSRAWDEDQPFDDDDDHARRHRGSRSIWLVTGLAALIALVSLLIVEQTIKALTVRLEPPRLSVANPLRRTGPSVEQARESRSDSSAPHAGAEPTAAEGTRPLTSDLELPARAIPKPMPEEAAPQRRRPISVPGLPRVELIRGPAPKASDPGGTYVVRISDTTGREPLMVAEASLVGSAADGTGLSIPLDPGPQPGTYHATIPHGRGLSNLRVRILTSDARFEVPVER
jgi:hypothetical protein